MSTKNERSNALLDHYISKGQVTADEVEVKKGAQSGAYIFIRKAGWISRHFPTILEAQGEKTTLLAEAGAHR